MEVRSVLATRDRVQAGGACEELRAHDIKCDIIDPPIPYMAGGWNVSAAQVNVVVAPEDEERARQILEAWAAEQADAS